MIDKVLRLNLLIDFYGALLTDRQRQCLEMHYVNDLSHSEIAVELRVSRQAVYDMLRRSEQILNEYEEKLKLVERYQREQQVIHEVYELLNGLPDEYVTALNIQLALGKLSGLLEYSREV